MAAHENPPPRRRKQTPTGWDKWAPRITRMIGWGGVAFVTAFWAATGRESAPLLALFGSFAMGAEGLAAWNAYKASLTMIQRDTDEDFE